MNRKEQDKQKWKNIGLVASCCVLVCVFIVWVIESYQAGGGNFDWGDGLLYSVAILLVMSFGAYGLIQIKRSTAPESEGQMAERRRNRKKMEKRRRAGREELKRRRDMFHLCRRYFIESEVMVYGVLYVVSLFLCFAAWKQYDGIPVIFLYLFWLAVTIALGGSLISTLRKVSVRRLQQLISELGYDEAEINADFMQGAVIGVMHGIVSIGVKYTVYFSTKNCFVILNEDILKVEKRKHIMELKESYPRGKVEKIIIRIDTKDGYSCFYTDNIGADMILEEYGRWGIMIVSPDD
ncbi:MAG: hypothetical protein NC300_11645 [Bacteroidales bacterium]|nr:hypothetical protein [Clostridium sp.]MCM1204785.1 hypothetical protein [Bacteroidales bacterium]